MAKMTGCLHLALVAVVLCFFCVSVHTGTVYLNGFTTEYGLTGCFSDPTEGCGGSDICYSVRNIEYAVSGTSPICSACMPKGFRSIASFAAPFNLPCALWRAYGCDDYFVSHVFYKTGINSCFLSGRKSYNIKNVFSSAKEAQDTFIRQCRQLKTFADFGLPDDTRLITERQFCFPIRNNISDIIIAGEGKQKASSTLLTNYKEYYEQKFNVVVKSTDEN